MQREPALTAQLSIGVIAGEVTLAASTGGQDGKLPEWIKVTPRGAATTRDGRAYSFNPESLVARFTADGIDLPVDTDHSTSLRGGRGETPNTIGHVTALEARPDGTYARVTWLDSGKAVLAARTHRYVSPTFHHDDAGNAIWLHSIALVSAPALAMPALAHAPGLHEHPPEKPMKEIAKALGLAEDATEAACLAALKARTDMKPIATALGLADTADATACLGAIGTLRQTGDQTATQLQAQLATMGTQLAAVQKAARDKTVAELIDAGLKARKITPAQKDHLVLLCATDDGLKNVQAMLAATPEGLQSSGLDQRQVEAGETSQDPATLAAEARKLMDERAAAGQPIGIADAMTIITTRKKG